MWEVFFASAFLSCVFLYLPGYFVLRSFSLHRIVSAACAPLISIAAFALLSLAYGACGVPCSWLTLVLPVVAAGLVVTVFRHILRKARPSRFGFPEYGQKVYRRFDIVCLGAYVFVGIVLGVYLFAYNLDGPASVLQEYDNIFHLGVIRGFLETGEFSFIGVSVYPLPEDSIVDPIPVQGLSFYPTAWHMLVALVAETANAPIALAVNAVNFSLISVVFPVSIYLLIRKIFYRIPFVVALGSVCSLAFADFPWSFVVFGPLYPNLLSLSVFPLFAFSFIALLSKGIDRKHRLIAALLVMIGGVSLAVSQPNAIFTAVIFLTPFCVYRLFSFVNEWKSGCDGVRFVAVVASAVFVVAVVLLWTILFHLPFFQQGVLADSWPAFTSLRQALVNVFVVSYRVSTAQLLLGALIVVGILYSLLNRRYLWLTCSYILMAFLYILDAATDGPLKHFLTGFWYSDPYRLAANLAVFAIPLACLGLYVCCVGVSSLIKKVCRGCFCNAHVSRLALGVSCVLFFACNYYPNFTIQGVVDVDTAFGVFSGKVYEGNRLDGVKTYDSDEERFVQKVKSILPEDTLLINEPNDGSGFAYGLDNLNLYYRNMRGYGRSNETEESKLIRQGLDRIANDENVKAAVDRVGAQYVLLFDIEGYEYGKPNRYLLSYNRDEWVGLEAINDDTPGFEVVLSEGDMRLYRIVA